MASMQDDINDSVWQGYVSAVSSLLLSLLLFFALMVLAMLTLGHLQDEEAAVPVAVVNAVERRMAEVAEPEPEPAVLSPITAQWVLRFPEQTVEISSDFHSVIAREIFAESHPADRTQRWLLRAPAQASSTHEKRIAFLRLFAARDFLISEGVAAADIDVRIVEPAPEYLTDGSIPVLVSRFQPDHPSGASHVSP